MSPTVFIPSNPLSGVAAKHKFSEVVVKATFMEDRFKQEVMV